MAPVVMEEEEEDADRHLLPATNQTERESVHGGGRNKQTLLHPDITLQHWGGELEFFKPISQRPESPPLLECFGSPTMPEILNLCPETLQVFVP